MLPTPLACSRFIGTISAGGTDIPANAKHAELVLLSTHSLVPPSPLFLSISSNMQPTFELNTRYAAPSAQNQSVCFESATLHL